MRRLTALIKAIIPFPAEIRDEFFKIVKVIDLMPGEWIPDDLPSGTSIFVEDGFLLLTRYQGKQWKCSNFYLEGTLAVTSSTGAAEMEEGSFRVRAAEPSRIYYLTRKDACRVHEIFPSYNLVRYVLRQRSLLKCEQRKNLFGVPLEYRIIVLDIYFRSLLRAPSRDLAEFLCLETEEEKAFLSEIQKIRLSTRKQLS